MHDLVSKKFGKLTVIEKTPARKGRGHVVWRCICDCGNQSYFVTTDHLVRKSHPVRSCGCRVQEDSFRLSISETLAKRSGIGADNPNWKGTSNIPLGVYTLIAKRATANHRGQQEFTVTIEELDSLWISQNQRCALTDEELVLVPRKAANASLDRIDSSKGYVPGNVQWVHKDVNIMKNMFTQDKFILVCNKVALLHPVDPNAKIPISAFGKNK